MRPLDGPVEAQAPSPRGERQDHTDEARRLLVLIAARPLVLSLAVGFGIAANEALFVPGKSAGTGVLLLSYVLTGVYLLFWKLGMSRSVQVSIQVVTDAVLVTLLIAVTGGQGSQYALLYLLLILYASLFGSSRGAVAAGVLCCGAYATLWLPAFVPSGTLGQRPLPGQSYAGLLFYCSLFVAVGAIGGFLARRAEQKDQKLKDAALELERIQLGTDVILESIGSGIMSIDSEGKVVHFNRTASQILGLDPEEVRNGRFDEVLGPEMSGLAEQFRIGLEENVPVFRGEVEITSADGRKIPLGVNTSLIEAETGKKAGVVALYQDLTEAKKHDERAKRQETLAALGAFSAGIAHEIRNCLSPIAGSAELLSKEVSLHGDARRLMDLILKETDRLEVFLTELLFYARSKPLETKPVALETLIQETIELVKQHTANKEGVSIEYSSAGPEIHVLGDSEQLKRVFVNLGVNALEALECGGELTIRSYLEPVAGQPPAGATDRDAGRGAAASAVVEFKDNGVGIPPETLHRILEPFYSTKAAGTGLGLSIAQRVVERHGGRLSVESRLGMGTIVKVHVPSCKADGLKVPCQVQEAA